MSNVNTLGTKAFCPTKLKAWSQKEQKGESTWRVRDVCVHFRTFKVESLFYAIEHNGCAQHLFPRFGEQGLCFRMGITTSLNLLNADTVNHYNNFTLLLWLSPLTFLLINFSYTVQHRSKPIRRERERSLYLNCPNVVTILKTEAYNNSFRVSAMSQNRDCVYT